MMSLPLLDNDWSDTQKAPKELKVDYGNNPVHLQEKVKSAYFVIFMSPSDKSQQPLAKCDQNVTKMSPNLIISCRPAIKYTLNQEVKIIRRKFRIVEV